METPDCRTRPVVFEGEEEKEESSKQPKIKVRKGNPVLVLADQPASRGLEASVKGDSRRHPDRFVKEREFTGDVMTLGQRIIV